MIHFQLLMAVTHLARPRWQSHAQRALWCWSHSRHPGQFCAQNNGPAAQEPWRTEGAPPLWANLLWTYRMAGLGDTNWWGGSKAICKWVQRCDTFVWDSGPAQTAANCKCLSIYQTESDMQCDRVQSAKIILQKLPCQEFVPLSSTQSNLFKWKHLRASYEHLTSILRASYEHLTSILRASYEHHHACLVFPGPFILTAPVIWNPSPQWTLWSTLVVCHMKHDYGRRGDKYDLYDLKYVQKYLQEFVGVHIIYTGRHVLFFSCPNR